MLCRVFMITTPSAERVHAEHLALLEMLLNTVWFPTKLQRYCNMITEILQHEVTEIPAVMSSTSFCQTGRAITFKTIVLQASVETRRCSPPGTGNEPRFDGPVRIITGFVSFIQFCLFGKSHFFSEISEKMKKFMKYLRKFLSQISNFGCISQKLQYLFFWSRR
jgi:hypothetical protein